MEIKHYKKYLRQMLSAGISKTKIQKECDISSFIMDKILKHNEEPSTRIQRKISEGYDKIVASFISLK